MLKISLRAPPAGGSISAVQDALLLVVVDAVVRHRASVDEVGAQLAAQDLLGALAGGDHLLHVDPGIHPHFLEHPHQILGAGVAGEPGVVHRCAGLGLTADDPFTLFIRNCGTEYSELDGIARRCCS